MPAAWLDPLSAGSVTTPRADKMAVVVARAIVHDIVGLGLAEGDTLPSETVMLERYGAGRASIREALRILEVHGLITIKTGPGGGPIVAKPTSGNFGRIATLFFQLDGARFRELVEARSVLEPVMARIAAERQAPDTVRALRANVEQGLQAIGEQELHHHMDNRKNARIGTEFHGLLAGASGNRVLDLISKALKEVFNERVSTALWPAADRPRIHLEHEAIVNAIEAGDGEAAERLTREHMLDMVERCEDRLPGLLDEVVDWR